MSSDTNRTLSLERFSPRSIAIVGASERPGAAAHLQQTLLATGFPGALFPVNPNRDQILGLKAYPAVSAIPDHVDLAYVMVAPGRVVGVLEDAAAAGATSAVIYTAGFAELGPAGRRMQRQIQEVASSTGLRILGPNCMGFVNPAAKVSAMPVPRQSIPARLRPGPAGLVSQSGGMMISVLEYASQVGLGFRLLASTGNEVDVTTLDLTEMLVRSPEVGSVGLIMEGVSDGRRLVSLAQEAIGRGKRIVALKVGRSAKGAAAALTHTAALAGSQRVFSGACVDAGIIQADTFAELVEHLVVLNKPVVAPPVRGGVAFVTISGGTKVLVADLAVEFGIPLANLSAATKRRVSALLPDIGFADNPLDLTALGAEDSTIARQCIEALGSDPGVSVVALVMHLRKEGGGESHRRLIRTFCETKTKARLVVVSSIPEGVSGYWYDEAASGPVPFLNDLGSLRAINDLLPVPVRPVRSVEPRRSAPPAIREALAAGQRLLGEAQASRLLEAARIKVPRGSVATSAETAVRLAEEIGYPVALKLAAGQVAHKSELGGVRLDLGTASQVADAYAGIMRGAENLDAEARVLGVLVQEMVEPGRELLVSVTQDPQFGTVVTVALGGIFAEVLDDPVVRLGPVTPTRAREMLDELRGGQVLRDFRGRPAVAVAEAAGVISRLSVLGASLAPWVQSIEINPLIVSASTAIAADSLAVLTARPAPIPT